MTITTELAQRMRKAAENATPGQWSVDGADLYYSHAGKTKYLMYAFPGDDSSDEKCELALAFIALANPANVLALLDALEAKDAKADRDSARIREMDIDLADRNGVIAEQAKEAKELRQRIAELEARTEQQPVGWTDEEELRNVRGGWSGEFFCANPVSPNADPRRVIKLYREQPAPAPAIVKLPESFYPDGDIEAPLVVALDDVLAMLSDAGIKIAEGE